MRPNLARVFVIIVMLSVLMTVWMGVFGTV